MGARLKKKVCLPLYKLFFDEYSLARVSGIDLNLGDENFYSLSGEKLGTFKRFFIELIELSKNKEITIFTEHAKRSPLFGGETVNSENL